ncbi:MAG: serine/threonine-protein kinase [Zoogloea sp.]|uniref:serine/threonine protein kinase n=1 Tax=Zoogloea sp. TaxID=49181 RepID=UPI0026077CBC|nr:serine/threonine-protein kinase [Zoogloea sp.]MDD2988655.1 serine/threonine-protein kinase [Zoogloea sp.]
MSNAPEEDDRTILSAAGNDTSATPGSAPRIDDDGDGQALPAGTLIGEFELRAKIGEGGFSIVYLAWDHSLERKVALKEYMPASIASRKGPATVAPRSERHRSTYEAGLRSFVNEAKLLAQFDHPALVKVYRFWEANGTAYMVMPLYEGETLKDHIQADRTQVSEAWLTGILTPLCDALRLIHGEQCFHRDIAPDNIILLEGSGRPLLLDFGAARRVIGDMTQALTVILKPGYAPVEQYAELPDMKQGPWTDVYALAATMHWVITGSTPPPSVGRLLNDQYHPLAERAPVGFSAGFLGAIDRALAARPEARTQTIADLVHDLEPQPSPPEHARPPAANSQPTPGPRPAEAATPSPRRISPIALTGGGLALACAMAAAWWLSTGKRPTETTPAAARPATPAVQEAAPPPARPAPAEAASTPAPPAPSSATPTAAPPAVPAAAPSTPPSVAAPAAPSTPPAPVRRQPETPAPVARPSPRETSATPAPVRKAPADTAAATGTKPAKPEKAGPPRSAECASILQRISLGESSPELLARFDKARCR